MRQQDRQAALRSGPRPLPLHLLSQAAMLMSSPVGLPILNGGSPPWRPHLAARAAELHRDAANADPEALQAAVAAEAARRLDAFLSGVERYRRHPYRRDLPEVPVLWQRGTTRLLDYGNDGGLPVLLIPSLVNRYYVLDLTPRRSLARYLAARGLRPLMVDWGSPGPEESGFGLAEYLERLETILEIAAGDGKAVVTGYCMGGLLALALAARRPERTAALALLATPWDFHAPDPTPGCALVRLQPLVEAAIAAAGGLPVDALQAAFAGIDPLRIAAKFRSFAALKPNSAQARDFVAVEDWLNDGVPLAAPVARECLLSWYGANAPARGEWRLAGEIVRPAAVKMPTLVMIPGKDRLVPPQSALPLAQALPNAKVKRVDAGHIGMIAGRRAQTKVYAPLTKWIGDVALR